MRLFKGKGILQGLPKKDADVPAPLYGEHGKEGLHIKDGSLRKKRSIGGIQGVVRCVCRSVFRSTICPAAPSACRSSPCIIPASSMRSMPCFLLSREIFPGSSLLNASFHHIPTIMSPGHRHQQMEYPAKLRPTTHAVHFRSGSASMSLCHFHATFGR